MSNEIELTVKGTPEAIGRLLNPAQVELRPDEPTISVTIKRDADLPVMNAKPKSEEAPDLLKRWRSFREEKGVYTVTMLDGTVLRIYSIGSDGLLVDRDFDIIWR